MDFRYEGRRANADEPAVGLASNVRLTCRSSAADYVRSLPAGFSGSMLALFLSGDFDLLAVDCLGRGNASDCGIKPMLLVRRGSKLGAIGFLLVHYAPERSMKPSPAEYQLTREIQRIGEDFDMHLLDHLILAGDRLIEISH